MFLTLLLQLALPVGLVVWLAVAPARSLYGYSAQVIGTGLVLLALTLAGLWMLLPWWIPYFYFWVWAMTIAVQTWRHHIDFLQRSPPTLFGWLALLAMCLLGAPGAFMSWQAIQGNQLPVAGVVDIPLPLGPGTYLVANGGSHEVVNSHLMTLNPAVTRFHAYRGQSYGIDLIKVNRIGLRASGLQPRSPAAYHIYGEPVYAPCEGTVVTSRNDRPDMPVPEMDRDILEGNHVLLDCGEFELLLAHLQPGSVRVSKGESVSIGDQLGAAGNSGNTGEPHLHISAQRSGTAAQPFSGEPLAITINGRFLVRSERVRRPK